jgi:release factor glutamine methyltransferase
VGTGSGILAVTLALEMRAATVTALDISPEALHIAQRNAAALGADRVRFLDSDLLASITGEQFDCIVSNPPYVPNTEVLEPQVARYEPSTALYAGDDGLAIYRRLIPQAAAALNSSGHLLLEIGHGQQEAVHALLAGSGFSAIRFLADLQQIPRVAVGRKT